MSSTYVTPEVEAINTRVLAIKQNPAGGSDLERLADKDREEVLPFLSRRPVHTVFMAGLIHDNGLTSPSNRGDFYGHRNEKGELDGVALIGQKTVIEAQDDDAFHSLMIFALEQPALHLIRGEDKSIERLLAHLESAERKPRLVCRELLLEQTATVEDIQPVDGLRHATIDELEQVMSINSRMAFEESGTNPLQRDWRGVSARTARRIEQGRVWVLVEKGRIIFKADVISETPEVIFLEGVYVHPEERARGLASRCMTQLGRILLRRASSLILIVNQENRHALALYDKINYKLRSTYRTVYF